MDWKPNNMKPKKMWPAAVASLVAFTSFVNAADDTQVRNLENRVSALEQRKGSSGMINPPARPMVKDGVDLSIEGTVLLWQANESGMFPAISQVPGTVTSGSVKEPSFDWDWGFKLAATYNMPHDGWDLYLQWTRFYSDFGSSSTAPTNGYLFIINRVDTANQAAEAGFGVAVTPPNVAANSRSKWKLHMNLLDLELGREFFVSKWLTLRPHAGLRSAWLNQSLSTLYWNTPLVTPVVPTPIATTRTGMYQRGKNNYWGMGLRAGLDGQWGLGGGWSLFSEVSAALLLGHFNITQKSTVNLAASVPVLNTTDSHRAARTTLDMEMGVRWAHMFADDRYGLMLQLGWEQHNFSDQNKLAIRNLGGQFTGLEVHGVEFTARFDF